VRLGRGDIAWIRRVTAATAHPSYETPSVELDTDYTPNHLLLKNTAQYPSARDDD